MVKCVKKIYQALLNNLYEHFHLWYRLSSVLEDISQTYTNEFIGTFNHLYLSFKIIIKLLDTLYWIEAVTYRQFFGSEIWRHSHSN